MSEAGKYNMSTRGDSSVIKIFAKEASLNVNKRDKVTAENPSFNRRIEEKKS